MKMKHNIPKCGSCNYISGWRKYTVLNSYEFKYEYELNMNKEETSLMVEASNERNVVLRTWPHLSLYDLQRH